MMLHYQASAEIGYADAERVLIKRRDEDVRPFGRKTDQSRSAASAGDPQSTLVDQIYFVQGSEPIGDNGPTELRISLEVLPRRRMLCSDPIEYLD
jgi:hypothetical protein